MNTLSTAVIGLSLIGAGIAAVCAWYTPADRPGLWYGTLTASVICVAVAVLSGIQDYQGAQEIARIGQNASRRHVTLANSGNVRMYMGHVAQIEHASDLESERFAENIARQLKECHWKVAPITPSNKTLTKGVVIEYSERIDIPNEHQDAMADGLARELEAQSVKSSLRVSKEVPANSVRILVGPSELAD